MQTALMLVNREQARVQTPAAPALHSWLRGVVFLPHIRTYTRRIIDGAICGGLLELTLCHKQLRGEFNVFYHETQ
jgi:hypothetical protein